MTEFISVRHRDTNRKHTIPAYWLEIDHPQFRQFTKTARQRNRDRAQDPAPTPVTDSPQEPVAPDTDRKA